VDYRIVHIFKSRLKTYFGYDIPPPCDCTDTCPEPPPPAPRTWVTPIDEHARAVVTEAVNGTRDVEIEADDGVEVRLGFKRRGRGRSEQDELRKEIYGE